jgi:hypothetical protein
MSETKRFRLFTYQLYSQPFAKPCRLAYVSVTWTSSYHCKCQVQVTRDTTRGSLPVASDILRLLHALKDEIPSSSLLQLSVNDSLSNAHGPLKFALNFYGLNIQLPCNDTRTVSQLPFVTAFQDILSISTVCATAITTSSDHRKPFRGLLVQALSLLNELVAAATSEREKVPPVAWNPLEWVSYLITALETEVCVVSRSTSPHDSFHCLFSRIPPLLLSTK